MCAEFHNHTPLTPERIVKAALEIVDKGGLESLSMRRLGKQLGVDPMAIYYHVPNKNALYDRLVEHLWLGVVLPEEADDESWQEVLYAVFGAFRERLLGHPRAALLLGARPGTTPTMLRLIDDLLGRLEAKGLGGKEAMQLIDCLSAFTVGKVLGEIGEAQGDLSTSVKTALAAITPETHPHLVATMQSGYVFAPDEEFERGLRALIVGWGLAAAQG